MNALAHPKQALPALHQAVIGGGLNLVKQLVESGAWYSKETNIKAQLSSWAHNKIA